MNPTFNAKTKHRLGTVLLLVLDVITVIGLFYLSVFVRKNIIPLIFPDAPLLDFRIGLYYWLFPLWILVMAYEGGYSKRFTFWDEAKFLSKCTVFSAIVIFTVFFIGKVGFIFSRALILTMAMISLLFFPIVRTQCKKLLFTLGLMRRKILIVGAGQKARTAYAILRNESNLGYEVAGFIDDEPHNPMSIEGIKIHRYIGKLHRYIKRGGIHDILIAKPELDKDRLAMLINTIQHTVENTLYMPDLSGIAVLGTELKHFFNEQALVIEIKNNLSRPLNYFTKRAFDYSMGTLTFLAVLLPIAVISLIIRLTSRGPAIFKHERIGKNGRRFICYKFRTMHLDADEKLKDILNNSTTSRVEWETHWKLRNDPRVTGPGRFLRQTSLDELPQILNVLKGQMSLVGPRPYLPREWDFLKDYAEVILKVPPGITGLWQISGRSTTTFQERLAMDSWYVRNWNLWLDIMIIIKTIAVVLRKEGAH